MSLPSFEFIKAAAKDKTLYCTLIISPHAFQDDIFDDEVIFVPSESTVKVARVSNAHKGGEDDATKESRTSEEIEPADAAKSSS
jgi:hypothetical protein